MTRRRFVTAAPLAAAAAAVLPPPSSMAQTPTPNRFRLRYAPHPGMFKHSAGEDVLDQIRFAADQGFTAWEDNGMKSRPAGVQEAAGKLLAERSMTMGVFVAHASFNEPLFARPDDASSERVLGDLRASVDVARRCGAKWMTVVPGSMDETKGGRLAPGYQFGNVVDLLRRCCDVIEPHGLVMVLEPLNWYANHGGVFLQQSDQAYAVCRAVNRPSCKILFDMYHQQITEGNILPNVDRCWPEIGYFQTGDNPGRREPGTGEMNYRNIFAHIARKSRDLVIGMEHGNSRPGKDGEAAVIAAYRDADAGVPA